MTCNSTLVSVFRHGINNDNIGPIAKASFEETPEQFLKAARHGELDNMRGVSSNVMCGQEGYFGTSSFSIELDVEKMNILGEKQFEKKRIVKGWADVCWFTSVCCSQPFQINPDVRDACDSGGPSPSFRLLLTCIT